MRYSLALISLVFAATAMAVPAPAQASISNIEHATLVGRSVSISEREYKRSARAARALNKRHHNDNHSSSKNSKCNKNKGSHGTPNPTPVNDYNTVEIPVKQHGNNTPSSTSAIYGSDQTPTSDSGNDYSTPTSDDTTPTSDDGDYSSDDSTPTDTSSTPATTSDTTSYGAAGYTDASQPCPGVGNSGGGQFLEEEAIAGKILAMHNLLRARHGVAPLTWSSAASKFSADTSVTCDLVHTTSAQRSPYKYGENWAWTSQDDADVGDMVVNQWYNNEIVEYNWKTGDSNGGDVGHFTQMVWADTTQVGCSVKKCNGLFMKCDYYVWGNYNHEELEQVKPILSGLSEVAPYGKAANSGSSSHY